METTEDVALHCGHAMGDAPCVDPEPTFCESWTATCGDWMSDMTCEDWWAAAAPGVEGDTAGATQACYWYHLGVAQSMETDEGAALHCGHAMGDDPCVDEEPPACPEGEQFDCNGACFDSEWIGDDFCDDGVTFDPDFNCEEFQMDMGDCVQDGITEGNPCWGVGEDCVTGTSCTFNSFGTDAFCLADQAMGASCGYDIGGCVDGATCIADTPQSSTSSCYANQVEGSLCGYGIGLCGDLTCQYTNETETEALCFGSQASGEVCATYGVGDCAEGSQCLEINVSTVQCVDNVPADGSTTCGLEGAGLCDDGFSCTYTDPGLSNALCYADSPNGGDCGNFGEGLCSEPQSGCILSGPESAQGTCETLVLLDGVCGYEIGDCVGGAICALENEGDLTGVCILEE